MRTRRFLYSASGGMAGTLSQPSLHSETYG
jgi:hypothetical protein